MAMMIYSDVLLDVVKEKETWSGYKVVPAEEAPMKVLENAVKKYAESVAVSDVLLICDETLFHSGKKGYLFTSDALYATYLKKQGKIPLEDLKEVKLNDRKTICTFSYEDGSEESALFFELAPDIADILNSAVQQSQEWRDWEASINWT